MFFVKFFWHINVIFQITVISLKIVFLSNKHQCYFLHLYINFISKNIKKYFTIYKSQRYMLSAILTQSIFIYSITLEKTLKTIYSYLKMTLYLFNKIYFVTFCIFFVPSIKQLLLVQYSVYQDGTNMKEQINQQT